MLNFLLLKCLLISFIFAVIFYSLWIFIYKQRGVYNLQTEKDLLYQKLEETEIYQQIRTVLRCSGKAKKITDEGWEILSDEINRLWPNFTDKLYKLCQMSKCDYRICLLIKIRLPIKDIANLMSMTSSGVGSVRSKLYERAFKEKKGVAEWDSIIDSL